MLEYQTKIEKSFKDVIDHHPDVEQVSCKCISVVDPSNIN